MPDPQTPTTDAAQPAFEDSDWLEHFKSLAETLVGMAQRQGVVLTIEQRSLQPLAQGHYETIVSVREARK